LGTYQTKRELNFKTNSMSGFEKDFLGTSYFVDLPDYKSYKTDIARNKKDNNDLLDYTYYSVLQSKSRKVPIFSASNIYRAKFTKVDRVGTFKIEGRINPAEQLNSKDYTRFNSIKAAIIEKGHMTKREDVQWDMQGNEKKAESAAKSTFFYPNAAPQHDRLNNGIWKYMENSIILKGGVKLPARVTVFTGPVLDKEDPLFKMQLSDNKTNFKVPVIFWKLIYYIKQDRKLYYAGFLMGQLNLLRKDGLIVEKAPKAVRKLKPLKQFLEFKDNEKYQVPVSFIEKLTRLKFSGAIDKHAGMPPVQLNEIQAKKRGLTNGSQAAYRLSGLNV
jgi:endonuclease G